MLIVVKATHANRRAVRVAADVVEAAFPVATRRVLTALADRRDPGTNALIFI